MQHRAVRVLVSTPVDEYWDAACLAQASHNIFNPTLFLQEGVRGAEGLFADLVLHTRVPRGEVREPLHLDARTAGRTKQRPRVLVSEQGELVG